MFIFAGVPVKTKDLCKNIMLSLTLNLQLPVRYLLL